MSDNNNLQQQLNIALQQQSQQTSTPEQQNVEAKNTTGKRKKTLRACYHCQKTHLTCDDARPCSRCIKRGLAATCTDGIRKKAKYLDDLDLTSTATTSNPIISNPSLLDVQDTIKQETPNFLTQNSDLLLQAAASTAPQVLQTDATKVDPSISNFLPSNFNFGSETVNLEYSILSNMIQANAMNNTNSPSSPFVLQDIGMNNNNNNIAASVRDSTRLYNTINGSMLPSPLNPSNLNSTTEVYGNVNKPYDYKEGFHHLVKYVKGCMEKKNILRICRALAQFRPSFMAILIHLSEEDLIFMEKCFQRTLTEYEKLINFSGTPTVVWRRTGEIALVGKEFSLLTQWPRDQLLSKKTYIYELMDNSSAVEYWEQFSLIAFDTSQQCVMTTCNLISHQGTTVPCAFCFTIKRDIFDVPLAIVGNFLPLFEKFSQ
ncbi:hypothetical protein H8356DRAFT_1645705 [Neocallimastix lanati (nom. inval.)]|jgi:hypothetical protein|nr:hypothetical protein H8356DRAFT_1645705 [Neocallimastix sp. JGI-2020a]